MLRTLEYYEHILGHKGGARAPSAPWLDLPLVLGPLLFSLYINDISSDIESEIRRFADECVCYREIKGKRTQ